MQYRKDIDGLRALAIIPVVLFHAGVGGLTGGFVGVDIFFVISGFLVTGILVREHEAGSYSIVNFYDRRIRRILPALFLMLAVTAVIACVTLLPSEMRVFGRSAIATVLFSSNILYRFTTGYFAPAAGNNPLLHTWSLGVEEQFYILFPLLLALLFRLRLAGRLSLVIAILALLSLVGAEYAVLHLSRKSAFYFLPFRGWELLLGSWLALQAAAMPGGRTGRDIAGLTGLLLIAVPIFLYGPDTRFPGLTALAPCLGAGLVIWSGGAQDTVVSRLLSLRPLVAIGLISYSLYLWHWPLLVFPRLWLMRDLTPVEAAAAIVASLAFATISWRWVERPFREKDRWPPRRVCYGALAAMVVAVGLNAPLVGGAAWRVPERVAELDRSSVGPMTVPRCDTLLDRKRCPGDDGRPIVLLWGDSHAKQYAAAMKPIADDASMQLRVAVRAGCSPLPGFPQSRQGGKKCVRFNKKVIANIPANTEIVILGGRWSRFFRDKGDPEQRPLRGGSGSPPPAEGIRAALGKIVTALRGRGIEVIIIGHGTEFALPLPGCLARAAWRHLEPDRCGFDAITRPESKAHDVIPAIARDLGVTFVDPEAITCPGGACLREIDSVPVNKDHDHLTPQAAAAVLKGLRMTELLRASRAAHQPLPPTTKPMTDKN